MREWRFLTNHGLIFLHKVMKPTDTVREIALDLGVTERAIHRILRDLEREGYLIKEKVGRRAKYRTNADVAPLSHQLAKNVNVRDFLNELTRHAEAKIPSAASSNGHASGAVAAVAAAGQTGEPVGIHPAGTPSGVEAGQAVPASGSLQ